MKKFEWTGTITGIAGALIIALNIDFNLIGFILFLISSTTWGWVAWNERRNSLLSLQLVFMIINIIGILRCF